VTLCVASWGQDLLAQIGIDWKIAVTQEQVAYFVPPDLRSFAPDRFPIWIWHGDPLFYGFPVYGEVAVKVSLDVSGLFVTPDSRSFEPRREETERFAAFLRQYLPTSAGPELYSKTCVYDMPADRDFILDRLPGHPRIVFGNGAGHAAKFSSLLGKILADLAERGETEHPIDAFRADRPALMEPDFEPVFRLRE
jgi:glycine/D-amino acid oxidase-like deaminating enzyme